MTASPDDRTLRREVDSTLRKRREIVVKRLHKYAEREGMVLYDGQWLTPEDARRLHRRQRLRGLIILVEVLLVCLVGLALAGLIGILFRYFAGLAI